MRAIGWSPEKVKWGGVGHARAVWVHRNYQVTGGNVVGHNGFSKPIRDDDEGIEII